MDDDTERIQSLQSLNGVMEESFQAETPAICCWFFFDELQCRCTVSFLNPQPHMLANESGQRCILDKAERAMSKVLCRCKIKTYPGMLEGSTKSV